MYLFDGYRKNLVTKLGLKHGYDEGAKVKLQKQANFFSEHILCDFKNSHEKCDKDA